MELLASGVDPDCDRGSESKIDEEGRGVEAGRDLAVVECDAWEHHWEGEGLDCPAGRLVRARGEQIVGLKFRYSLELQNWIVGRRHFFFLG